MENLNTGGGQSAAQVTATVDAAITAQVGTANAAAVKTALNATGSAPIYAARAWVSFNGLTGSKTTTGSTYSRNGSGTVTINFGTSNPGLAAGDVIYVDFTTGTATDGIFTLLTFGLSGSDYVGTFTQAGAATSGSSQIYKCTVNGSGNVSSVTYAGTGIYYVNFSTPMPSINYACECTGSTAAAFSSLVALNPETESTPKTVNSLRVTATYVSSVQNRTYTDILDNSVVVYV